MADLDSLQASQSVKIAGASSSGAETTYVNATLTGELRSADILNIGVAQSLLVVNGTGSPVEVKAGASRLINRKSITIQAQGSNVIWGYSATAVTGQIFTIANGATITISAGDTIAIYIHRSSSGNVNVAIAENS